MSILEPNHICKWCGKAYYACNFCDMTNPKRSVSCSDECYYKYESKVLELRAQEKLKQELNVKNNSKDEMIDMLLPKRTDLTDEEVKKMILETPVKQAKEKSIRELNNAGYGDYLEENGLSKTIDKVNKDITNKKAGRKAAQTKKVNS